MAEQSGMGKGEAEVGAEEARKGLTELMGRVAFGNERIVLTRNGKRTVALVSIDDLARLQSLDMASETWRKGA